MAKIMPKRNLERVGLGVTGACVALVTLVVLALIIMVAQRGLTTFIKDGVDVAGFFTGTKWNLASTGPDGLPATGALPLIVTSFSVTVLSTVLALPVALGSAIFTVEIAPKFGRRVFQPLIELLVGIPSVVFGLIGFHVPPSRRFRLMPCAPCRTATARVRSRSGTPAGRPSGTSCCVARPLRS